MSPWFLAAGRSGEIFGEVLPWLLVILGVAVVGAVVIIFTRRLAQDRGDAGTEGFTLQHLRDLHAAGELSDEEFQRAKESLIGSVKRGISTPEAASENTAAGNGKTPPPTGNPAARDD